MSKRTAKQRVSYVEVDSNADLAASDDGLMKSADGDDAAGPAGEGVGSRGKGKGRATSPAEPPQKKTRFTKELAQTVVRRPQQGKEYKPPTLNADLLLNLPFDILVEICRQLDLADLIHLSRTSRAFRNLLLAPSGRQLWAAVRIRDGYFVPQSMSEVAFALLIVGGDCQVCAVEGKTTTYWTFRVRMCKSCGDDRLISRTAARKKMVDLHSDALECVRYVSGSTAGRDVFLKAELEAASLKLQELEAEDSLARGDKQRKRVWTTKSRRRTPSESQNEEKFADAVETYIKTEKERVKHNHEDMKAIEKSIMDARKAEVTRRGEAHLAQKAAQKEREQARDTQLKASHGWTDEHLAFISHEYGSGAGGFSFRWLQFYKRVPLAMPDDDPAGWLELYEQIDVEVEKERFVARNQPGWDARLAFLEQNYDTVKAQLDESVRDAAPNFDEFKDLEAVKALWHPEDAQLDVSTWPDQEPLVKKALEDFAESMRIHAIRVVLAAQTGKALKSVSVKAAKYPVDKYGDEFFGRITALFFRYSSNDHTYVTVHYPDVLKYRPPRREVRHYLEGGTSFKRVCAIRSILHAAKMDEDTATPSSLDALSKAFTWPDAKDGSGHDGRNWIDMINVLTDRHGPSIKDLKAGAVAKLELVAPKKDKGKSRAMVAADSDGDESDDNDRDSSVSRDEPVAVAEDEDDDEEEDDDADDSE
ncbi:hypothetical protein JCM10449v2_006734 [Rhodotorula kratochvilovae]